LLALGIGGLRQQERMTTGSIRGPGFPSRLKRCAGELSSAMHTLRPGLFPQPRQGTAMSRQLFARAADAERNDQSLAVMRKPPSTTPMTARVLAAYGKALAAAGQFEPALDAIRRAQTPEYPDWKLVSAEAAILDQLGQTDNARQLYQQGAGLGAERAVDPLQSRHVLRDQWRPFVCRECTCARPTAPGADSRVRQNLALVVGLQGRFEEAEQIARQELSPEQAQANVAYLRSMLSQQNAWSQLENEERATN
jgi:tetratricopeptide (TPR) repeat protein